MINAVSNNVAIREIEQPQGEVKQPNISYKGNPSFERAPSEDYYDAPRRSGGSAVGTITLILAAIAVGLGCGSYFKGKKMLEGQESKFMDKIKTGGKELWTKTSDWVKNIFNRKKS